MKGQERPEEWRTPGGERGWGVWPRQVRCPADVGAAASPADKRPDGHAARAQRPGCDTAAVVVQSVLAVVTGVGGRRGVGGVGAAGPLPPNPRAVWRRRGSGRHKLLRQVAAPGLGLLLDCFLTWQLRRAWPRLGLSVSLSLSRPPLRVLTAVADVSQK